ncbi:MAG: hypothetical protein L3J02_04085 [Henriciella sp.]|nr:hypothetical protein [Henriciella sp.]
MGLTAKEQDTETAEPETSVKAFINETGLTAPAAEVFGGPAGLSPARALQDRLSLHFAPVSRTMSSRYVTLFLMFAVLGTWMSVTGLNTGLQV